MVSTESGIRHWAQRQAQAYQGEAERPLGGYLGVMGAYASAVGAAALLTRVTRRSAPERVSPYDLVQMSVATHRISRTVAKDPVTSPLRAPFTTYRGTSAPAELDEEIRGHGVRHSVGELLTCPMCLAQWVATGLSAGLVLAPRQTRLLMAMFSAVAGADFLQYIYAWLQQAAE
ncbi:MAG: DUF1360 domain-containing protein [Pseudonocardiales bacterium]|nr:DUF1360 domain-containing protein [Actinomycetota bacterium]